MKMFIINMYVYVWKRGKYEKRKILYKAMS